MALRNYRLHVSFLHVANLLFRRGASRSVTKQQIFDYIEGCITIGNDFI